MKNAMYLFGALALFSGLALLWTSFGSQLSYRFAFFLVLGLGAIAAAVKYTAGKNPYGYKGLGDIFVFLFFGIVGVAGTYYLHTHQLSPDIFLPAISIGLLCAGVLNVNNMRDRVSDANTGKITIAVRLGATYAKYYHLALIVLAWVAIVAYTWMNFSSYVQLIFLITVPLFVIHLVKILNNKEPALLDGQLKTLVLSTLAYCITFGISELLNK
jgi:1,4-dihydroxy-2-naphthoate octaprenyltransferase